MIIRQLLVSLILLNGLGMSPGYALADQAVDRHLQCGGLQASDFSQIVDAPTQVTGAKFMPASEGAVDHCEVRGYVAPSVGFMLRLPSDWNGKFLEVGCGGSCGTIDDQHFVHPFKCADPLRRGYACIASDGGNRSSGLDFKWAYNNPQAVIDYYRRASHVAALAGKAIAAQYYGRAPGRSYFMGCSSGGMQAMFEAQRFPWDFDGILAGAPAVNVTGGFLMNTLWANLASTGKNGEPLLEPKVLEILHRAVVERCDLNDGIKDGLIGDPRQCRFDASELQCAKGRSTECLTENQIEAIKKIYGGPRTSKGEQIALPNAQLGSEMAWSSWLSAGKQNFIESYIEDWFRYFLFQPNPGPTWRASTFDWDRDYQRLGTGEVVDPANDPDLRRFKARGGKLLSYTGWNDVAEGVLSTANYYEIAERVMGGRTPTQDFFRLFTIPGMNHCGGGDGAYAVDYLSYLEAWVEKGDAPEKLIGFHPKVDLHGEIWGQVSGQGFPLDPANVAFSRPIYPYPIRTKYLGRGDPNAASSFGPENR